MDFPIGTVLATATMTLEISAAFSGPHTFAADIVLHVVPRVKILGTWQTGDCTTIDGSYTATRVP